MKTCRKHPKYRGKKAPKDTCDSCLRIYIRLGGATRKPTPPPTKVIPDKTKYNRKKNPRY